MDVVCGVLCDVCGWSVMCGDVVCDVWGCGVMCVDVV